MAAAVSMASGLGLRVQEAFPVHVSNRLALRLRPSESLARVASSGHEAAPFEIEVATRLAGTDSPVAGLDPRVAPRVYERDGFTITFWTYYERQTARDLSSAAYADALSRLHAGMRQIDVSTPHFTDRVREAQVVVESAVPTPELADANRSLLLDTLSNVIRSIAGRSTQEQLLHGEPHPGNVLNTKGGPLFIDLETCCRGPVEFDLAHVPEEVSQRYPNVDQLLLQDCRLLVLAMVAAWRFDPGDQLPSGRQAARELLAALRAGPPYPALGAITGLD
jgi:aminoglycoside phosphotransferase (APT) family kinase protein